MLHTEVVKSETLELLKRLQADPMLKDFYLVGGTALALYMGHRESIDLDLFSCCEFEELSFKKHLQERFALEVTSTSRQTLKGFINGVKIDCIAYPYGFIRPPIEEQGVRLASTEDICAMKLVAISENGTRLKDFVDVAFLSTKYSFCDMLGFYEEKYSVVSAISAMKGLVFFDDIRFDEEVMLIGKKFDWIPIAKRLEEMVKNPSKVFQTPPLQATLKATSSIVKEAQAKLGPNWRKPQTKRQERAKSRGKGVKF